MAVTVFCRRSRRLSTTISHNTRSSSSSIASSARLFVYLLFAFLVVCCFSLQPRHHHHHHHHRASPVPHRYRSTSNRNSRYRATGRAMASSASAAAAATVAKRLVKKNVGKLHPSQTVLLLCDVQERFRPLIYKMETVVHTCQYMTSVCQALNVPILATQQYTKVFGPTIAECFADSGTGGAGVPSTVPVLEKKKFSMLTDEVRGLLAMDESSSSSTCTSSTTTTTVAAATAPFGNRPTYIVVGIEAHVCVQQTCLDLLEQGDKDVHIICDAVSSQQASDRLVALRRLEKAGAYLTTAQSAAFMLLQSADHECFKQVSKLTVEHMKKVNEFNIPQDKSLDII